MREVEDHCYTWWESFKAYDINTVSIEESMDIFEVDGLRLSGRIDILIETKQGLEIHDIKTAKSEKHITKGEVSGKYYMQLLGYGALVKNTKRYEGRPLLLSALYFITEPEPDAKKFYTVSMPSDIELFIERKMRDIIHSLQTLSFIDIPVGNNKDYKPVHIESVLKEFVESLQ